VLKKYESSIETTITRRCTTNDCVATSARSGRITVRYLTRSAAICDCAEPRAAAASSCLLATQIRSRPILPAGGGGGPAGPTQSAVVSGMTGGEADPRGTVLKRPHPSALCRIRSRWRCPACSPPVTARYQVSVHSQDTLALIPPPNNPPPPPDPAHWSTRAWPASVNQLARRLVSREPSAVSHRVASLSSVWTTADALKAARSGAEGVRTARPSHQMPAAASPLAANPADNHAIHLSTAAALDRALAGCVLPPVRCVTRIAWHLPIGHPGQARRALG
jgi:hypothetical protein